MENKASKKDIQLGNRLCKKFMDAMRFNGWLPVCEYTNMVNTVGRPSMLVLLIQQNNNIYNPVIGHLSKSNIWIDEFGDELEDCGSKVIMVKPIENINEIIDKIKEDGLDDCDDIFYVGSTMHDSIRRKCRLFPLDSPFEH